MTSRTQSNLLCFGVLFSLAAAVILYMWLDRPRLDCEYSNLKYYRDSFEWDYTLWMRADMTKEEFIKYAKANQLTLITDSEFEMSWETVYESWWNPPEEFELGYYSDNQSPQYLAVFAAGKAYIQIIET